MYFFFDYIWYRIAKLYYKRDSDGITASAFLSLSQGLFIGFLVKLAIHHVSYFNAIFIKVGYDNYTKFGVGIIVCLLTANYLSYKKKYWKCREHWMHETKPLYYIKGLLVVIVLLMPPILFIYFPTM